MTNDPASSKSKDLAPTNKPGKLAYVQPELKQFGDLKGMTQGASGPSGDGQGMNMASSDRRVKENIVRVGQHPSGVGLYLFDYKPEYRERCGYGRRLGVMADEVAAILPEAVHVHPDGHLMVDYALLATRH